MFISRWMRKMAAAMAVLHLCLFIQIPAAHAAMIGTPEVISEHRQDVDRQQLMAMLDDEEVKLKLESMGVDRAQVQDRINNLTAAELAQFNQQLDQAPAGGNVVGVIILFLVIFIVTDMLCATNIFNFVNCVNR